MGAATQPQPFGKYYLLERIATGGMAEIFKAKYRAEGGFEKTLVIKRILPHLAQDDDFIAMFRDEAHLTVRLNHANIVQVFDFGKHEEDYFLAMEYVQGQNLRQVMRRCQELGAPVPIPFALLAVNEVAKGLNYAHTRRDDSDQLLGVIHRDVTPSNVLVSYEGEVKIADFGIAKAQSRASGTQAGMIKGKAAYLAPEQVMGRPIDARVDLFSLGAVLWEMLVGRKLFTGDTDFEIMAKITKGPIPAPSQANAAIPPDIDHVVMRCLERDPERRYPGAAALQKDLTPLLQKYGATVTTVDVSSFLRRIFRKEMEAEREASKSLRLPTAAQLDAASEGATLIGGADRLPAVKRKPGRTAPWMVAGVGLLVGAGAFLGARFAPAPDAVIVIASPTPVALASPHASALASPGPTPERAADPTPTPTPKVTSTKIALVRPSPSPSATPTRAATPIRYGVLKLDSQPWGEIYVDGRKIGRQTPAFDLKLPAGTHEIRLVNPVQKLETSFRITVEADRTVKKSVKLQPSG